MREIKRYHFLIILLQFSIFTFAQDKVCGIILDANTGRSIPGANIIVKGTTIGTISNNEGKFTIPILNRETYSLRISFTGYETQNLELKPGSEPFVINLQETAFDLNAVVVTATRTEKNLKNVPILTQVITDKQLDIVHTSSIQDLLETFVPDINFSRAGFGTQMSMQGLDAKYTLFLIDGERIAGETYGNIDYDRINISDIERIEIIRGASSSLYGSNAIGGVINIITKDVKQPWEISIKSKYSKFNDLNLIGNIGLNKNKVSSKTEFGYRTMDGYDLTPSTPGEMTVFPYNGNLVNQKLTYSPLKNLKFYVRGGYYSRERFDVDPIPIHNKYYDFNYLIKSEYLYSKKNKLEMTWASDKYRTVDVQELANDNEKLTYSDQVNNARILSHHELSKKQYLTIGTEYQEENLFTERVSGSNRSYNDLILFAQNDITIRKKLNAIIGFRINQHSVYGLHVTPQVSLMQDLSPFKLRASYSSGYRAPTLKELYMDFSPVPVITIHGNENLKPENSNYFSGSVEYLQVGINGSITYYHSRISNMILETNDLIDPVIWSYMNINQAIINGVEARINKSFKKGITIGATYNYKGIEDDATNQQVWGSYKHSAVFKTSHFYRKRNYKLTTSLHCKILGDIFYNKVDEITGIQTDEEIPAHSLWRVTATQSFLKGLNLTLGVDNIFNFVEQELFIGMNPGRRFFVSLNIDFHKFK